jgi:acyl carrier protein
MSALFDTIAQVISRRFRIDPSELVPDASFEELGLDSLSQIELATSIEKELGIKISDDDISQMSSIADIVQSLESRGIGV